MWPEGTNFTLDTESQALEAHTRCSCILYFRGSFFQNGHASLRGVSDSDFIRFVGLFDPSLFSSGKSSSSSSSSAALLFLFVVRAQEVVVEECSVVAERTDGALLPAAVLIFGLSFWSKTSRLLRMELPQPKLDSSSSS
jgi:hypothetical protein